MPIQSQVEQSLAEIDFAGLTNKRNYYPSPAAWEDELLYFLFIDRFSDGNEFGNFSDIEGDPVSPNDNRSTPLFNLQHDAFRADWDQWFQDGRGWCGGSISGLQDKLGYLKRLGVSAVWLSPIFKQVTDSDDYHGYGIQNFLDVDPHYGTREQLKTFVAAAHETGIRVILDIILNHAGDVFTYKNNHTYFYHQGRRWPVQGYRKRQGDPGNVPFGHLETHPDAWPDSAVWPSEFHSPESWAAQGQIRNWDAYPEYLDGDFFSLKELNHGRANKDPGIAWDVQRRIREFHHSPTLEQLCKVYQFWIAYADIDGFRLDTVKHMEPGAVRYFANVIHEFAQSLGKENFYIIGEITGGRGHAVNLVNTTGIDAALGINDIPDKLEYLAKGYRSPGNPDTDEHEGYFDLFRNSLLDDKHTHQWYAKHIVTMFDDHDQVGTKHKYRFCGDHPESYRYLPLALGLNLTTAGIPCIYYGTEQNFNGSDPRKDRDDYSDAFLRECMFGGPFGSFQSTGKHFFKENHETYQFIQRLSEARRKHIALRRGRQYLRQVSQDGEHFYYPELVGEKLKWVVAWSRMFASSECLCAINTADKDLEVWVTLDHPTHRAAGELSCLISTDSGQQGQRVPVQARNGSAIHIRVPAFGFIVYG
ncbi:MAG: alpha-amylase family glycosyl hydrolase [Chromatiales bacterium]|nr:alpha-amylase [Gammaproteobacteria bacterium]